MDSREGVNRINCMCYSAAISTVCSVAVIAFMNISLHGPTFLLLGHIPRVAFTVSVVALLLPRGPDATALHFVHFLRQISCWGRPLCQSLGLLTEKESESKKDRIEI